MEGNRWKVKQLNAFDCIPEFNLVNTFITSPKLTDISEQYQEFKSMRSKSPQRIKYRYCPPVAQDKKVVKYEGPRLNKELPKSMKVSLLRTRPNAQSSLSTNPTSELFIENLIRNRQELILPSFEKPKNPYKNLKEQLIKTRPQLLQDRKMKCDTLLQNIKESMKSQTYKVESEMSYWDHQPLRKWDKRNDRVLMQKRFKNINRSAVIIQHEDSLEEEERKNFDAIGSILEACGDDILNWPD